MSISKRNGEKYSVLSFNFYLFFCTLYPLSCLGRACTTRSLRCYRTSFWTPPGSCSEADSWRSSWFCCRLWSRLCWWLGRWADWFRLDRWTPAFPWCWLSAEKEAEVRLSGINISDIYYLTYYNPKANVRDVRSHRRPLYIRQKCRLIISIAKMEVDRLWFIMLPSSPFAPSSPLLLPASGPADVTVPLPYASPPSPTLSSRVKLHCIVLLGWIMVGEWKRCPMDLTLQQIRHLYLIKTKSHVHSSVFCHRTAF